MPKTVRWILRVFFLLNALFFIWHDIKNDFVDYSVKGIIPQVHFNWKLFREYGNSFRRIEWGNRLTSDFEETQRQSQSLGPRDSRVSYQVYTIRTLTNSKFQASITVAFLGFRRFDCEYCWWYSSGERENLGFRHGLSIRVNNEQWRKRRLWNCPLALSDHA